MEAANFELSSPLTTAALETALTSERINQACQQAFDLIMSALADRFRQGELPASQAQQPAWYSLGYRASGRIVKLERKITRSCIHIFGQLADRKVLDAQFIHGAPTPPVIGAVHDARQADDAIHAAHGDGVTPPQ
jgi:hypothetical protein